MSKPAYDCMEGVERIIPPVSDIGGKLPSPAFSDDALALTFAEGHCDDLRFVDAWNKWLIWDGQRWEFDTKRRAFTATREVCRLAAGECNDRNSRQLASGKTVAAVNSLAKCDQRLAADVEQWDSDPWLLNTPDGVIDLRTGERRPAEPDDYMTKITAVAPGGDCPRFLAFLDEVTAGAKDLQLFMQRVFGYGLTGSTQEHALFFGYGTGANGKSVLINTVAGILGDYHKMAPIETFTASHGDRHPTELAGLRGARLVTAIETEEGRRWAESRIKALTGGDKIAARFMRQDFFEFEPAFKLFIAGNHKPGLRSVDEAIRRRFNMIPFIVTIPAEKRDPELTEKLKAEWPGILQWMIDGCLNWQEQGLRAPESVKAATAEYLESQDAFSAWVDECCQPRADAWESRKAVFESWSRWATTAGEFIGSRSRFLDTLEQRGFEPKRDSGGNRGYLGLAIKQMDYSEAHWNK